MPPPLPSASKAAHVAAIQDIERQEQGVRDEIARMRAERSTLQAVLDSLQKKENGTSKP